MSGEDLATAKMETVSNSVEIMDAAGNAQANDLVIQVALTLRDGLLKLSAGNSVSEEEVAALRSILEIAARELGVSAEEHPMCYKRRKKLMDSAGDGAEDVVDDVVCRHSCSSHMELPNPALWSSLPHELLQLIFARLSLRDIRSLRCVSKAYDAMVTTDSDFHRLCDAVNGSSFALVDTSYRFGAFWVRVFNATSNTWDSFKMVVKSPALARPLPVASKWNSPEMSVICGDGGLLCFVCSMFFKSKLKKTRPSLFITVVHPLTGTSHELPPLLDLCNIRMMQIMASSETKGFKVFVLGDYIGDHTTSYHDETGGTAEVYDSTKRTWGRAEGSSLGLVFGRRCCFAGDYSSSEVYTQGPCAYDFVEGRLHGFEGTGSPLAHVDYAITYAQHKDRFFVLRMDADGPANESLATQSPTYYIEEFRVHMPARTWVKVFKHRCAPFEHPPKSKAFFIGLHACQGFLLVLAQTDTAFKENMRYGIKRGWLYDLTSRKWRDLELPLLPLGQRMYNDDRTGYTVKTREGLSSTYHHDSTCLVDFMCDLKWSA